MLFCLVVDELDKSSHCPMNLYMNDATLEWSLDAVLEDFTTFEETAFKLSLNTSKSKLLIMGGSQKTQKFSGITASPFNTRVTSLLGALMLGETVTSAFEKKIGKQICKAVDSVWCRHIKRSLFLRIICRSLNHVLFLSARSLKN